MQCKIYAGRKGMLFYDYTGIAAYHREMKKSSAISGV